jgi:invasion protein IalB
VESKRRKKSWRDLSRRQQLSVLAYAAGQLTLLAAALTDLKKRPAGQVKGSKGAWAAACFVNYLGPLAYFLFGRKK